MEKNVYIVRSIEYDGDTCIKLVNHDTFQWVIHGGPMPLAQKTIQIAWINAARRPRRNEWRIGTEADWDREADEAIAALDDDMSNEPYADQERGMAVMSDDFGGHIFDGDYVSLAKAMSFIRSHDLNLVDEFNGKSW